MKACCMRGGGGAYVELEHGVHERQPVLPLLDAVLVEVGLEAGRRDSDRVDGDHAEHAEAVADPLEQRLPWPYQKACISSGLSSRLVYREGLHFVEALPEAQLASFAFRYLTEERRVRSLAAQVASSGLGFSAEVEALLLRGGVRTAAEMSDA